MNAKTMYVRVRNPEVDAFESSQQMRAPQPPKIWKQLFGTAWGHAQQQFGIRRSLVAAPVPMQYFAEPEPIVRRPRRKTQKIVVLPDGTYQRKYDNADSAMRAVRSLQSIGYDQFELYRERGGTFVIHYGHTTRAYDMVFKSQINTAAYLAFVAVLIVVMVAVLL